VYHNQEINTRAKTINGVPTSITAFIGETERGPVNDPHDIYSFKDFDRLFGDSSPLAYSVRGFFDNAGKQAFIVRLDPDESGSLDYVGNFQGQTGPLCLHFNKT
jgi:phage tail sheath protein FI